MGNGQKIALKLSATLLATAIAFCLGAFATGSIVHHLMISGTMKRSFVEPLGAEMPKHVLQGGIATAFVVFLIGIIWTVMTSSQQKKEIAEPQRVA